MFKLGLALASVSLVGGVLTVADYCSKLVARCGDALSIPDSTTCQAALGTTVLGTVGDLNTDTIACRLKFLDDVAFNSTESCRYAGPSGGGRCGSVLANVCRVSTHVCDGVDGTAFSNVTNCTNSLGFLAANWGSQQGVAAGGENSLECRVYHAIAHLSAGDFHCSHFSAVSVPCTGVIVPGPSHYCELLENTCNTPDTKQFTDKAQCLNAVKTIPTNASDSAQFTSGNTLGCRVYHAQAAALISVDHCGHAGPSGGGVCGTELEAWGSILNAAPCSDKSVKDYVQSVSADVINAAIPRGYRTSTPTTASYTSVLDNGGNTQACRVYHLGVAAAGGAALSHCAHGDLSGAGNCGADLVDNLCLFIKVSCTFGTNASWQFADMTACKTGLANSTTNVIQVGAYPALGTNSYACRFYHASVAASFLSGGANYNAAMMGDSVASNRFHCGHVLKIATAGGCGSGAVTPTTAAPTSQPKSNSAPVLSLVGSIVAVVASFSV